MRIVGGPEVAAARRSTAVPELVLGGRIVIGVRVRNPVCDLRPFVGVQAVIVDGGDRRGVGQRVERE